MSKIDVRIHGSGIVGRALALTLARQGLGVGIDQGDVFDRVTKDHTFAMESGDCLLLYTDGVNEALDPEGEEYSDDRIKRVLAESGPKGATAVLDSIMEDLNTFTAGKASHDDVTMIVLQKT